MNLFTSASIYLERSVFTAATLYLLFTVFTLLAIELYKLASLIFVFDVSIYTLIDFVAWFCLLILVKNLENSCYASVFTWIKRIYILLVSYGFYVSFFTINSTITLRILFEIFIFVLFNTLSKLSLQSAAFLSSSINFLSLLSSST